METIFNIKDQPELDEMVKFLKSLNAQEQSQISALIQGVKLGISFGNKGKSKETA